MNHLTILGDKVRTKVWEGSESECRNQASQYDSAACTLSRWAWARGRLGDTAQALLHSTSGWPAGLCAVGVGLEEKAEGWKGKGPTLTKGQHRLAGTLGMLQDGVEPT